MAKRSTLSKSITTVGSFTRNNLERVGAVIDSMNAKTSKPRQFKAVNLGDEDYQQDLFREQTLKATQQLLGPRFATYGKYAKKVVPNSFFQSTLDGAFAQIAKLAANWSQIDLPNQHRFADIASLDNEQRYALATDIANQNRALATLGGITGLAGLPGLLADTLWLLLVSLRTVYQLGAVYNKPLTGKQGVKMAYELLANADLSKMQEKQALLAGIGIGKGLLDNAQSSGLHSELKNLGLKNTNVNFYAEQVDKIAGQVGIDLDQINLSWMRRLLPFTAVFIGMRYNSQLIDEVIGVAQATFAPETKLANRAITDDSSSEAEVTKPADKDKQQDSKNAESLEDAKQKETKAKDTAESTNIESEKATAKKTDKKSSGKEDSEKKDAKPENVTQKNTKQKVSEKQKASEKKSDKKGSAAKPSEKSTNDTDKAVDKQSK
ncbi:EcsC family protein [Psychrobacter sp. AOP22-C1-22]|uniref:EcsC family protein n=1 Tax=unclassified Psychrobacter TaxID=196806 RepID=UPI00178796AB|nr:MULTISPECIES: EcsC family protein [unclassified Psychrobacter]MBE0406612.1 EcsC family protein [Psychrobacter sp. FME6]MBE0445994.1 EcsC family protein [Psychrobacter sp. FME5]MDN5802446.1 EcsC family protein [Psychrobacter sp.]MDN5891120.1 EcsC family protein [Psychrobacter sp.]